ncbi:MAG: DNA topoisomerase [Myxococcota bacterium]
MAKALVITEKPSVARDIVAALGGFQEQDGFWESDDWVVTFSVGHIVQLLSPEDIDDRYKRWTLDTLPILPEEFRLKPKSGASERIRTIKRLLARADLDRVVNACDAGREGELIFREILQFLGSQKPVSRLWLQSMTPQAIRDGFAHLEPGERYEGLASAAACRSQSDWLIGMNATRALTRRLQARKERAAWSAGRVQTPTLAILVDHELKVLAHVPRDFWRIEAQFDAVSHSYAGVYFDPEFDSKSSPEDARDDRIFDKSRVTEILAAVRGQTGQARETRKPSRETAPPLFDLTSLQREANRRFGWSARRTLSAAQRCYEAHKLLTYPRTDSKALPNDYRRVVDEILTQFAAQGPFRREAADLLSSESGLQNTRRTFDDSKVSDHFAIIPTGKLPEGSLSSDDGRLFELVARRFLATFYPPAVWNRVERVTEVAGYSFRSRSRTLETPGWRAVVGQTEQEDQALPPLVPGRDSAEGVEVRTAGAESQADETRPPPRISEARLLSLMESAGRYVEDEEIADAMREKGIGTVATRADVIENLIQKGYLMRLGKGLRPTVKGIRLIDVLRRIQIDRLASSELTGELEFQLLEVEQGARSDAQFMKDIQEYTTQIVDRAVSFDYEDLYPDKDPLGTCPCGKRKPVYERAWFYRCIEEPGVERDDDCPFRIWKDKSGRYIDRSTVKTLLEKKETRVLDGFSTRDGRIYKGILRLEDLELTLESAGSSDGERASSVPEYEVDERPLGPCPMGCGSEVIETPTHFRCRAGMELEAKIEALPADQRRARKRDKEAPKPCPMTLPRTVCKREITRDEAEHYLAEKRTEPLSDFISRYGRPFAATLFLKPNGRHGFEFAKRTGEGKGRGGRKRPGTSRKRAPTRKATRKKTPRKKAAAKKSTRKKTAAKKSARKKSTRKKAAAASRPPADDS